MPKPPASTTKAANYPRKPLTFNTERYSAILDAFELTDEQKAEYLDTLWLLVVSFADLDFPILFEESCGQITPNPNAVPDARASMLYSKPSPTQNSFDEAANVATPPRTPKEAS